MRKEERALLETRVCIDIYIYFSLQTVIFRVATNDKENDQIILFIHCHIAASTSIFFFFKAYNNNGKKVINYK